MSQIERDYKQVKSSNILDKEYSAWFSYKKQRENMNLVMDLRCSLDGIVARLKHEKRQAEFK
jgi:hypothetical protein